MGFVFAVFSPLPRDASLGLGAPRTQTRRRCSILSPWMPPSEAPREAATAREAAATDAALFTFHLFSRLEGLVWSWDDSEEAQPEASLSHFVWPPSFPPDRPVGHAFSTTDSKGGRAFGFVLAWAGAPPVSEANSGALVLLSKMPLQGVFEEVLLLAHERLFAAAAVSAAAAAAAPLADGVGYDDTDSDIPSSPSSTSSTRPASSACSVDTDVGSKAEIQPETGAMGSAAPPVPSLSAAASIAATAARCCAAATAPTAAAHSDPAPVALAALCDASVAPLLAELQDSLLRTPAGLALRAAEERGNWCGEAAVLCTLWQRLRGEPQRLLHLLLAVHLEHKVSS